MFLSRVWFVLSKFKLLSSTSDKDSDFLLSSTNNLSLFTDSLESTIKDSTDFKESTLTQTTFLFAVSKSVLKTFESKFLWQQDSVVSSFEDFFKLWRETNWFERLTPFLETKWSDFEFKMLLEQVVLKSEVKLVDDFRFFSFISSFNKLFDFETDSVETINFLLLAVLKSTLIFDKSHDLSKVVGLFEIFEVNLLFLVILLFSNLSSKLSNNKFASFKDCFFTFSNLLLAVLKPTSILFESLKHLFPQIFWSSSKSLFSLSSTFNFVVLFSIFSSINKSCSELLKTLSIWVIVKSKRSSSSTSSLISFWMQAVESTATSSIERLSDDILDKTSNFL